MTVWILSEDWLVNSMIPKCPSMIHQRIVNVPTTTDEPEIYDQ